MLVGGGWGRRKGLFVLYCPGALPAGGRMWMGTGDRRGRTAASILVPAARALNALEKKKGQKKKYTQKNATSTFSGKSGFSLLCFSRIWGARPSLELKLGGSAASSEPGAGGVGQHRVLGHYCRRGAGYGHGAHAPKSA